MFLLAQVAARRQEVRAVVWMLDGEEVGESTGSLASARFLQPWEVLVNGHPGHVGTSYTGNRYLATLDGYRQLIRIRVRTNDQRTPRAWMKTCWTYVAAEGRGNNQTYDESRHVATSRWAQSRGDRLCRCGMGVSCFIKQTASAC